MNDGARRGPLPAFALSALIGTAIWALSTWTTGTLEPWDAEGFYYVGSLAAGGVISGLANPRPLWAHYAGSVLGQLLYALVFLPVGPLIVLGVGFLLAFSALFLVGAFIGATLRRHFAAREPSA